MKKLALIAMCSLINSAAYCDQLVEMKAGYFFFTDSTMSKVFDRGGLDLQISGSYPIWKCLNVYGSVEWMEKSGSSLNVHQKTRFSAIPLSLGLKPLMHVSSCVDAYATLGPRYLFAHVSNSSSYVDMRMNANGIGGFANIGLLLNVYRNLTLDLFTEYSYSKLRFRSSTTNAYGEDAQIGGLLIGCGLGYRF